MALKPCRECGTEVSTDAKTCPKCGVKRPTVTGKRRALGALAIVSLVAVCYVAMSENGEETTAAVTTPAVEVSAQELYEAYEANELAADQRYKDQQLRITGAFSGAGTDVLGTPYVTLETGNLLGSVQCMLEPAASARAATLVDGDAVTLIGQGSGYLMNVIVRGCTFAN